MPLARGSYVRTRERATAGRGRLLAALVVGCFVCLALLAVRIAYSGRETYDFLAWNLVLAAIPLALALLADTSIRRGRWMPVPVLLLLWILFLPNAPYVVTDFVHLSSDPPVPLWFDVLLFTAFAWTALLMGLVSMHVLAQHAVRHLKAPATWALIVILLAASSAAIYLGRFDEWNSWDLLVRPLTVLEDVFSLDTLPRLAAVTAGFTGFLVPAYMTVDALLRSGERRVSRPRPLPD